MSYNWPMVKPKSSNRSIRLPDEMWAWLAAESDLRQTSVNGLVGDFLMVARLKAEEARLAPPKPAKPKRPKFNEQAGPSFNEQPAAPKLNIQVGPVERKPGSLQKKGK